MNFKELQNGIENLYKVQNPQPNARREKFDAEIEELKKQKQRVCSTNPHIDELDSEIQIMSTQLNKLKKQRQEMIKELPECQEIDNAIERIQKQKRKINDYSQDYNQLCYDFEVAVLCLIQRWSNGLNVSETTFFKYWQHIKNTVSLETIDDWFDYKEQDRIDEFRNRTDALINLIQLTHGE